MTLAEVEALLAAAQGRGLRMIEFEKDGASLRAVFRAPHAPAPAGPPAPAGAPVADPGGADSAVTSPGVGFFRRHHPAGGAMPQEGGSVEAGTVIGFVQAGPLLQAATAPCPGRLGPLLVEEGAGVGFGTVLAAIL